MKRMAKKLNGVFFLFFQTTYCVVGKKSSTFLYWVSMKKMFLIFTQYSGASLSSQKRVLIAKPKVTKISV